MVTEFVVVVISSVDFVWPLRLVVVAVERPACELVVCRNGVLDVFTFTVVPAIFVTEG